MKPYYLDKYVTIYHGDCREILPHLDTKVDLVLTDPPYNAENIGVNNRKYANGMGKLPEEEYNLFCKEWFAVASAVCNNLIFTPGIRNIWKYPPAKWVLCWHKPGSACFNSTGGFNIWEPILLYGKTQPFSEDYISRTPDNFRNGPEKKHPCPKTRIIWQWLVHKATKEGMTILDPMLGSGTTAVVAKKLGRKCIGIEIEESYCEIAVKRLSQQVMELNV